MIYKMAGFVRLFLCRGQAVSSSCRCFSVHQSLRMPRVVRDRSRAGLMGQQMQEVEEELDEVDSKWNQFLKEGVDGERELKISASFGSVRMDRDNIPRYEGQFDPYFNPEENDRSQEREKFGHSYSEESIKHQTTDTEPESMFFLQSENEQFRKFKPFKTQQDMSSERLAARQRLETAQPKKRKKTETFNAIADNDSFASSSRQKGIEEKRKEKPQQQSADELNYFDDLLFKETYSKFDTKKINTPVQVKAGEQSLRDLKEDDLNVIDQQYISASVAGPVEQTNQAEYKQSDYSSQLNSHEEDLGYIDQQFFGASSETTPNEQSKKGLDNTSQRFSGKNENTKFDTERKRKSEDIIEKIEFDEKRKVETKGEEKAEVFIEPRARQRHQKKTSPAMEYVRNLRNKMKANEEIQRSDPVDQIGVGIMARLSSAALVDNSAAVTKTHSDDQTIDLEQISSQQSYASIRRYQPPDLKQYTSIEVEELLTSKVLYNDHEIVALWKPYGLSMFPKNKEANTEHSLERYLPFLANHLGYQSLYEVHRIDQTTSGVLLLATSQSRRKHLKQMLAAREIVKSYYLITNGVPSTMEGVINVPIGEGKIGDRFRPTLRPDYKASQTLSKKKNYKGDISMASTDFRVLCKHGSAALVECLMFSGVKHQIRLHMGLGLGTPILGDNKYSWPDRLGPPQRIKGDILQRLNIKRSHGRNLPIFLHSRRISIPNILENEAKLTITASKPHFFTKVQQKLKLTNLEKY